MNTTPHINKSDINNVSLGIITQKVIKNLSF